MWYQYKKIIFLLPIITVISLVIIFVISNQKDEDFETIVQNENIVPYIIKEGIRPRLDYLKSIDIL